MTTLPFVAVYLLMYLKRKRWRDYLVLGILIAITGAFFYIHFGLGKFLTTQLFSIIGMSGASAPDFLRFFLRVLFVGFILVIAFTRSGEHKQMISGWILLALFFFLFLVNYEKAWYLMILIALVCLLPDWRTMSLTYVVSFSGFLIYTWNSGFNSEFAAPILVSLPRYVVYLVLPIVVVIGIGTIFLWKKLQQKGSWRVSAIPR